MSVSAVAKAVATAESASKDEQGKGIVLKTLIAIVLVLALIVAPLMDARANTIAKTTSLSGLPAWVTREFLRCALEIQEEYGLFASVTIAQAHLEVGGTWDGASLYDTAAIDHNYFGLKAAGGACEWEGQVTWDGRAGTTGTYRKYSSVEQGQRDRARLLLTSSYYSDVAASAYGFGTSQEQAQALSNSPWCENGYTTLLSIMETYSLCALDTMTVSDLDAPANADEVVRRAYSMIGRASYVWGACNAQTCQFDCSGFVSWCLTGQSVRLGTTDTFIAWPVAVFPQPGDVVVFTGSQYEGGGHCGIFIGAEGGVAKMIDCSDGVAIREVDPKMVYRRYG